MLFGGMLRCREGRLELKSREITLTSGRVGGQVGGQREFSAHVREDKCEGFVHFVEVGGGEEVVEWKAFH